MIMNRFYYIIIFLLFAVASQAQQEHQFTQFMYNQLYYNPAYAGARNSTSIMALYRNQWTEIEGSPESKLISFNGNVLKNKVGLGITVANHTAGIFNQWNASMAYSYKISINEDTGIRFGLQGSLKYYGIEFNDPSVLVLEGNDPSIVEGQAPNTFVGNFGAGLYFTHKNIFLGASVPHFFPNEIGFNENGSVRIAEEKPHLYLMAGSTIPINEKIAFRPSTLFKYVNNAPWDLDLNVSVIYDNRLSAGISYRIGGVGTDKNEVSFGSGDSVDLLLFYQYESFGIGAAYDFTLSDIRDKASGSFEVLLRYDFKKEKDDMANPRFFN